MPTNKLLANKLPANKLPDTKLPDTKLPDTKLPDAKLPDAKLPDAKLPDNKLPGSAKLPAVTRPARATLRPGSYALESLKLPEVLKMEAFDGKQPAWPPVERGVVVVTSHADDPLRFLAFLVDVKNQRIVAIRDGETARHFLTIGQQGQGPGELGKHGNQQVKPTNPGLASSGAVIILPPPRPIGPRGWPTDFTARILDVAAMTGSAAQWLAATPFP